MESGGLEMYRVILIILVYLVLEVLWFRSYERKDIN